VGRGSEHLAARDGGAVLLEQDYVDASLDRLGSLSYAELGLLQAGCATDEASDFGQ
jgi:ribosome assembly protein YihI (activator of Der GTPase)